MLGFILLSYSLSYKKTRNLFHLIENMKMYDEAKISTQTWRLRILRLNLFADVHKFIKFIGWEI